MFCILAFVIFCFCVRFCFCFLRFILRVRDPLEQGPAIRLRLLLLLVDTTVVQFPGLCDVRVDNVAFVYDDGRQGILGVRQLEVLRLFVLQSVANMYHVLCLTVFISAGIVVPIQKLGLGSLDLASASKLGWILLGLTRNSEKKHVNTRKHVKNKCQTHCEQSSTLRATSLFSCFLAFHVFT